MWEWSDRLKLGKSSAFVKRDLRALPLTDAEFEADVFLDPESSTIRQESWMGLVIEREVGGMLALENGSFRRPRSTTLPRFWLVPCKGHHTTKIANAPAQFIFGTVPNGRNCCRIFGNWESKSS